MIDCMQVNLMIAIGELMLKPSELIGLTAMPLWQDISLKLYKDFAEEYLVNTLFRYYLKDGQVLEVHFTEEGIYHMLGIQHINGKISGEAFFDKIDEGLDFNSFVQTKGMKKRFNDFKHRIRSFACIFEIMRNNKLFYVKNHILNGATINVEYIKHGIINEKGINVGIRKMNGLLTAFTVLVDRAINPIATIDGLQPVEVVRLEIIRNHRIVEEINY